MEPRIMDDSVLCNHQVADMLTRAAQKLANPKNYTSIEVKDSLNGKIACNRWDCGCMRIGQVSTTCSSHETIPPIIRRLAEPVRIDSMGRGSVNPNIHVTVINTDTDEVKSIRRRVEDALRKGGDGQVLRCAEILGVKIF